MTNKEQTAEERVKAVYPDARFCPSYLDKGMIISGTHGNYTYLGDGWGEANEAAAWIKAASRLPPAPIAGDVSLTSTSQILNEHSKMDLVELSTQPAAKMSVDFDDSLMLVAESQPLPSPANETGITDAEIERSLSSPARRVAAPVEEAQTALELLILITDMRHYMMYNPDSDNECDKWEAIQDRIKKALWGVSSPIEEAGTEKSEIGGC